MSVDRRRFLSNSILATSAGALVGKRSVTAQDYSDYSKDPRPDVAEGAWTAGGPDGPVFAGSAVVTGPAADEVCILQPVQRLATGYLEYAVEDGDWQRVDADDDGLAPLAEHVLKFRLPPLPPGKVIRHRVVARTAGWIKVRQFYHGEFKVGEPQTSEEFRFRTLDPTADQTTFAVWNDTHENEETLKALDELTNAFKPDFMLWNGDQSNDVHFENQMAGQFLVPEGLAIADRWPMAYVRGNHDCRGPAARSVANFTGTPGDRFYYAFRSGPLAAIVLDTGEDKPDDSPYLSGMGAFQKMAREQADWLKQFVKTPWFVEAPHKVLFCHIPLWFDHPRIPGSTSNVAAYIRSLCIDTLTEAGVKLVISGHTHDFLWMPKKASQPMAQLIGGAPHPKYATLIQGVATPEHLHLKMMKLDGTILTDVTL
ncbi:MAG: metallophosphoesterase [Planctomycetaceae bacterium]|nr:metallophosphoesterase [Planctomycetaceae bacterium]